MSRIGNRIITVPEGVTVENIDNVVTVKGPKGTLTQPMLKDITMKQEGNTIILERLNESAKAMHGTMNALINNMITGVTNGYSKSLEIIGVGYRFNVQGDKLVINADNDNRKEFDTVKADELKQYVNKNNLGEITTLPKVDAAVGFVLAGEGRKAVIANLEKAKEALAGKTGTTII